MKLYSKIILTAVLGLSSFAVQAGDYCFTPGRSCNVQPSGACCDNNGYLFAYGGFSFLDEINTNFLNRDFVNSELARAGFAPVTNSEEILSLDSGFVIGGGAGIRSSFLGGSRFEIEGIYAQNDFTGAQIPGGETFGNDQFDGEFSQKALMFNFLKEIPVGCLTGYVGGGFGIALSEADTTFTNALGAGSQFVSDQGFSFAHQFIVGADLPVADCLSLFLQYKLFNGGDVDLLCPTGVPGVTKLAEFEGDYASQLVFGARFFY